jgi:hypothetical protein
MPDTGNNRARSHSTSPISAPHARAFALSYMHGKRHPARTRGLPEYRERCPPGNWHMQPENERPAALRVVACCCRHYTWRFSAIPLSACVGRQTKQMTHSRRSRRLDHRRRVRNRKARKRSVMPYTGRAAALSAELACERGWHADLRFLVNWRSIVRGRSGITRDP